MAENHPLAYVNETKREVAVLRWEWLTMGDRGRNINYVRVIEWILMNTYVSIEHIRLVAWKGPPHVLSEPSIEQYSIA